MNIVSSEALSSILAVAVKELRAEGESENTVRSYRTALKYWAAWHALRYEKVLELPVRVGSVVEFVIDHLERNSAGTLVFELAPLIDEELVRRGFKRQLGPLSLATVAHRIAALSALHRQENLPNPCEDQTVRELMKNARRAYAARGERQAKKPALTREPLQRLLATCDDSLVGVRDRALLLFAVATGGRRRSEIAEATMAQLRRMGPARYVFQLEKAKTNQAARVDPRDFKPVIGDAGEALEQWLARAGISTGRIFRRVRVGGRPGEQLSAASVRNIVIFRSRLAGLEEAYSAHSLRSGFMTQAGVNNVPLGEAMSLSGHASVQTAMRYFRAGNVLTSSAARLFDSKAGDDPLIKE